MAGMLDQAFGNAAAIVKKYLDEINAANAAGAAAVKTVGAVKVALSKGFDTTSPFVTGPTSNLGSYGGGPSDSPIVNVPTSNLGSYGGGPSDSPVLTPQGGSGG